MTSNRIERPALGQLAGLSDLYDARSDTFTPGISLFKTTPSEIVDSTPYRSTYFKRSETDSYGDKFSGLGVEPKLGASFLAGLVTVQGSGQYLEEKRDTNLVMQSSMIYNITTRVDQLKFKLNSKTLKSYLSFDTIHNDVATHVVSAIT
jgi:hypothetical protein